MRVILLGEIGPIQVPEEPIDARFDYNNPPMKWTGKLIQQRVTRQRTMAAEATGNSEMVDSKGESSSESHTTSEGHEQTGE